MQVGFCNFKIESSTACFSNGNLIETLLNPNKPDKHFNKEQAQMSSTTKSSISDQGQNLKFISWSPHFEKYSNIMQKNHLTTK